MFFALDSYLFDCTVAGREEAPVCARGECRGHGLVVSRLININEGLPKGYTQQSSPILSVCVMHFPGTQYRHRPWCM